MRYHVYSEARYPTGPVSSGALLSIYDDAAGTIPSSIYAAAFGGSPLANPYTVPATGIVDFWVTVPEPYYIAAGDTVARPLPVIFSPGDANTFTADQTIGTGHKLHVNSGAISAGAYGNIELDCDPAVDPFCAVGFMRSGVPQAQIGPDAYSLAFSVCPNGNPSYATDRINIGNQSPFRVGFACDCTVLNNPGQPFYRFTALPATVQEESVLIGSPAGQNAPVLDLVDSNGLHQMRVTPIGDAVVARSVYAPKQLVLSNGTDLYGVTAGVGGALTSTILEKNFYVDPFHRSEPAWSASGGTNVNAVPGFGFPSGFPLYARAQHWTLASPGYQQLMCINSALGIVARNTYVFSDWVYVSAADSGTTLYLCLQWRDNSYAQTGAMQTSNAALTPGWQHLSISGVAPSLTTNAMVFIVRDAGGTNLEMWASGVLIQNGAVVNTVFDGDTNGCYWVDSAPGSCSYRG